MYNRHQINPKSMSLTKSNLDSMYFTDNAIEGEPNVDIHNRTEDANNFDSLQSRDDVNLSHSVNISLENIGNIEERDSLPC